MSPNPAFVAKPADKSIKKHVNIPYNIACHCSSPSKDNKQDSVESLEFVVAQFLWNLWLPLFMHLHLHSSTNKNIPELSFLQIITSP
jgi:hypothetical protein